MDNLEHCALNVCGHLNEVLSALNLVNGVVCNLIKVYIQVNRGHGQYACIYYGQLPHAQLSE